MVLVHGLCCCENACRPQGPCNGNFFNCGGNFYSDCRKNGITQCFCNQTPCICRGTCCFNFRKNCGTQCTCNENPCICNENNYSGFQKNCATQCCCYQNPCICNQNNCSVFRKNCATQCCCYQNPCICIANSSPVNTVCPVNCSPKPFICLRCGVWCYNPPLCPSCLRYLSYMQSCCDGTWGSQSQDQNEQTEQFWGRLGTCTQRNFNGLQDECKCLACVERRNRLTQQLLLNVNKCSPNGRQMGKVGLDGTLLAHETKGIQAENANCFGANKWKQSLRCCDFQENVNDFRKCPLQPVPTQYCCPSFSSVKKPYTEDYNKKEPYGEFCGCSSKIRQPCNCMVGDDTARSSCDCAASGPSPHICRCKEPGPQPPQPYGSIMPAWPARRMSDTQNPNAKATCVPQCYDNS